MVSVDLAVATNMRVDLWDQETFQDYLQVDHRFAGEAAVDIVAILGEARQRREERKRWDPSFAVFKYRRMKPFSLPIYMK